MLAVEDQELSAESSTDIDCISSETPRKEEEDYRVKCKNKQGLDRLLDIAVDHVTRLAESQNLGEYAPQFVSNFTENFVQIMQENVTVNGLPWVAKKETSIEINENDEFSETTKNMLSTLSKQLETVAAKRKTYPKKICSTYKCQMRHERKNVKVAKIKHNLPHPLPVPKISKSLNFTKEYSDACQNLISAQNQLKTQVDELIKLEDVQIKVDDIMKRNKPKKQSLNDTGYLTE